MSSFVAAILKVTVGLLVNRGRNVAAEKLKEGDVTNEQLRNLIVRELDDIKSKLDGLARRDLLASMSFFKEGLVYLYNVKPNEEDGKKTQQGEDSAATPLKQDSGSSEASVKTVSLAEKMRSLQLTDRDSSSGRALNHAKEKFKEAQKKAIEAFCNEALSTSDRILAMQYRIMATILEKVDCLTDALPACRLCLEELHSMPAVKKSLDVHLQQGFKSMFNKAEREDTIRSVCRINRVIFYITEIIEDTDFSLWPCVDLGKYTVDPLRDFRVTDTIKKEDPEYFRLKTWPLFQEGEETRMFKDWFITTNTKGQFIIVGTYGYSECILLKVFDRNGNLLQSLHLKLPVTTQPRSQGAGRGETLGTRFVTTRAITSFPGSLFSKEEKKRDPGNEVARAEDFFVPEITDIASDRANNVFLLAQRPDLVWNEKTTVTVFDQHANFQHTFDVNEGSSGSRITVSDDNKVFVVAKVKELKECVLVYSFHGVLLNSIKNETLGTVIDMTSIDSEGSKIAVLSTHLDFRNQWCVYQFSEQGNVLSQYYFCFDFGSPIRFLPKTEHVAILNPLRNELLLHNKNGEVVRETKLSPFKYFSSKSNAKDLIVTTQGLVAMLTTDETGKKRIDIV